MSVLNIIVSMPIVHFLEKEPRNNFNKDGLDIEEFTTKESVGTNKYTLSSKQLRITTKQSYFTANCFIQNRKR